MVKPDIYETEGEYNAKISTFPCKETNMPQPIFYINFNKVDLMVGLLVSLGSFAKAG